MSKANGAWKAPQLDDAADPIPRDPDANDTVLVQVSRFPSPGTSDACALLTIDAGSTVLSPLGKPDGQRQSRTATINGTLILSGVARFESPGPGTRTLVVGSRK